MEAAVNAMLVCADLYRALAAIPRPPPDWQQRQAIEPPASSSLFIVAGPGTGKTTSLTLRILKLVLVDAVPPRGILATTFTNKAAEELRSRVLGWGFKVIDALKNDMSLTQSQRNFAAEIDINQVWTGTVDSLCEQLLREHRAPGTQPPILIDDFVSKTLMLREGLFTSGRHNSNSLSGFLLAIHSANGNTFGWHAGKKAELLQDLWERRFQDQVDWPAFVAGVCPGEGAARQRLDQAHSDYETALTTRGFVDFSLLENEVLRRLRAGQLDEFREQLQVVLVDEYQDTNLMQEQLYFELARACGGALAVVGDDDQSLYRFRGATVDLFRDFAPRYQAEFGRSPTPVFLTNNYRSTPNIIHFVDGYANLDLGYQAVRVAGKPSLAHDPAVAPGLPILGMFRSRIDDLAHDLAVFIHSVFRGRGVTVPGGRVEGSPVGGDVGDCALLCSSPAELAANGRPRLPALLRQELTALNPPIQLFNPRGEELTTVPIVSLFGGLLLECLDPGGAIERTTNGVAPDAMTAFQQWRTDALNFTQALGTSQQLIAYAVGWADRNPNRAGFVWPKAVPVLELIYGLVHFFPELHDDPEGQVYLEVFTRQLAACEQVGKFGGRVLHDPADPGLGDASVKELIRDFLAPIASGLVSVNEDLVETFPRNRLSILSIHQSKGLEFPLTIVDVGSDFKDLRSPKFKRFPDTGGPPHRLEDLLRPHSPLGRPSRGQVDRAFDDLYRQFFVAFSRPQDVLLLVGVDPTAPGGRVENVATGWRRDGVCPWAPPNLPFEMI